MIERNNRFDRPELVTLLDRSDLTLCLGDW